MNKAELIEHIARQTDLSKLAAARALDAVLDGIAQTLEAGGTVTLAGFGTFAVSEHGARVGRNPRTGETLTIAPARAAKFKPGKTLKDALNSQAS